MSEDWIMEVLCDLRTFAQKNGLFELASELDTAIEVAARELGPSRNWPETVRAGRNHANGHEDR